MNPGVGWQNVFKTGSFFGEVSLLGGSGMSASLEALGGSGAKFMVLDKNSFQASISNVPGTYVWMNNPCCYAYYELPVKPCAAQASSQTITASPNC